MGTGRALIDISFPLILLVFLGLYIGGLLTGAEPEFALLRAGGVGLVLAVLARLAGSVLDAPPAPPRPQPEPAVAAAGGPTGAANEKTSEKKLDISIGEEKELS